MSFISLTFLIFFTIILLLRYILQDRISNKYLTLFLLVCNYVFYCYWDYRYFLLLLALTIIVYFSSLNINNKLCYYLGLIIPIIILCFFKYFNFFLETLNVDELDFIIPVGVSFYTFELISYIVDVKKRELLPEKNFLIFATYVSFFPNIVSGPISRAKDMLPQFNKIKKVSKSDFETGIQIMVIGFFKKMVIADRLNVFVSDVYSRPNAFSWCTTLLAILTYSVQIYMDFSGYSDIAIGCAKCLGFSFKNNFYFPYLSNSITDFWRRWHISLSTWFKDYVYIPLGGNRKGRIRQMLNLLIVMTLSGLWHGANWNFAIWGFINGLLLCLEKFAIKNRKTNILTVSFTFLLISVTWVFFRADSFDIAITILKNIITLKNGINQPYLWSFVALAIMIIFTITINKKVKNNEFNTYLLQDLNTIKGMTLFLILIGLILCFAYTNTSQFVYFQF